MILGDSRDRLNLDDTAPGVVDRVRPPRLAKPELHPRKAVLRPIIPRSHHPRHFHYSLFCRDYRKLGLGSHCSESLPVSMNCFFFGRKQNRSWFLSYLETTCFFPQVVLLTVPATPNMSCFLLPAINSNPKDALLGRDEIHTTPDLLLQCNHESFFRALFQHYTYYLFFRGNAS